MDKGKKLVLIVVDGMTPAAFERAVEGGRAPALAFLAAHGSYRRATSVFPSLTPVCLSSIATGAGPDVHRIPHLVWWHRGEQRIVEYGSSFAALRAAGMAQSLTDTIYNMNEHHLGADARTIYESLEDAGLVTAAVNITCYRGRTRHVPTLPWVTRPAFGPKRFFYYNLFESDQTGAPLSIRNRAAGSTDVYAAAVGRWLVTRDGFDFLAYYLSDFDYASHAHGPSGADDVALERTDAAIAVAARRRRRAGCIPRALRRRAALRSRTDARRRRGAARASARGVRGRDRRRRRRTARARSISCRTRASTRRSSRAGSTASSRSRRRFAARATRRSRGATARSSASAPPADGWETSGDAAILDHPDALRRVWSALANPNAGELLVSAAEGWELDRSRRPPSRGRRQPRLARRRRLDRAAADDRRRRGAGAHHGDRAGGARALRRRAAAVRAGARPCRLTSPRRGQTWWRGSFAHAASTTNACSTRWRASRASCSCPLRLAAHAYDDAALPIGSGQTISQPYMVARICSELALRGGERVLDVGTGSGYQAAVLAELAAEVHSIERIPELAERARATLDAAGYGEPRARARRRRDARAPGARALRRDRRGRRRAGPAALALRPARAARPARRPGRRLAGPDSWRSSSNRRKAPQSPAASRVASFRSSAPRASRPTEVCGASARSGRMKPWGLSLQWRHCSSRCGIAGAGLVSRWTR